MENGQQRTTHGDADAGLDGEYADLLTWYQYWHTTLDTSDAPCWKWFVGGKINASYNCIDRHLPKNKNKTAIHFVPELEEEAVHHVAARIRRTQDILERRIAMENVSYYAAPGKEMDEIDFINAVLTEADCDLLLDVNNIYVNSINHHYDAEAFLKALPADRVMYFHIAGHRNEAEDLIVDTHGADIVDPVWDLLDKAYAQFGVVPTLLERDFNLPPLADLLQEVEHVRELQAGVATSSRALAS